MERKYYLRGLGLGIVVTAIIMGIVSSRSRTMTDSEIVARAKELGMVENTILSEMHEDEPDSLPEVTEANENSTTEDNSQPPKSEQSNLPASETVQEEAEVLPVTGKEEQPDSTNQTGTSAEASEDKPDSAVRPADREEGSVQEENTNDMITSAAIKTITVNSGDGSHTVAKKLADAGVVISADDFDAFLCQYGYDKKLRTGTFSIPADASDEQIAKIVTGME
ncbi:MAG: hypothetical protein K1W10_15090 [Lachnospiraceae bacterium]